MSKYNFFDIIYDRLYLTWFNWRADRYERKCRKKYPNWNPEQWAGDEQFIWGAFAYDNFGCCPEGNIFTMYDISITRNHKDNKYKLFLEQCLCFDDKKKQCEYLKNCLYKFTKYMDSHGLEKNYDLNFFEIPFKADTIPELYTQFRIFVDGFCDLYKEGL